MNTNNYEYQITAAKEVLNMALSQKYIAAVLAAAPGSGKSTMTVHILNDFFEIHPDKKALVLTHNQNLLKKQMIENFEKSHAPVNFTYGDLGESVQVQVGIPSSRNKINDFDLLIVDEAHAYYWESMYGEIVKKHDPDFEILLTGSPSYFVKYNKAVGNKNLPKFGIYFIAASDLKDVFAGVDVDVATTNLNDVVARYSVAISRCREFQTNLDKIIVAVKNIEEANTLSLFLSSQNKKVSLSTSANDRDNQQIEAYRANKTNILIIVNRGILGFSDNETTALIDLKPTQNLDTRYQLFARILRKHPNDIRKTYISVVKRQDLNQEVKTLHKVVSLMDREVFVNYTGE